MGYMKTREYKVTQVLAHIICLLFSISALLPFILMTIGSFTDDTWASLYGFTFFPGEWSLDAYRYIVMKWEVIGKAYLMTIIVTLIGTSVSLVLSTLFAYGISKTGVKGMKVISFLLIFTMLFNGGLVSTYYSYVRIWGIKDTIWALIVPGHLMNAFNVVLLRNYFTNSIPASLEEAAKIDGASIFKSFLSVVLPLSKPILATVGLMTGLGYWNDWQNGLYYLSARNGSQYYTIQIILNNINENVTALTQAITSNIGAVNAVKPPSVTIRMAIAVVGILPIVIAYPFFQRYFVKGITLGGVKE